MEDSDSIEMQPHGIWSAEFLQRLEEVFQDAVASFRQSGFSQEQITAFFELIGDKAHHYCQIHSEEMTRH